MISQSPISRLPISVIKRTIGTIQFPIVVNECTNVIAPFESTDVIIPFESRDVTIPFESTNVVIPFESTDVRAKCHI